MNTEYRNFTSSFIIQNSLFDIKSFKLATLLSREKTGWLLYRLL